MPLTSTITTTTSPRPFSFQKMPPNRKHGNLLSDLSLSSHLTTFSSGEMPHLRNQTSVQDAVDGTIPGFVKIDVVVASGVSANIYQV
jgi:hypothetical protein